jgi:hypothetical protein
MGGDPLEASWTSIQAESLRIRDIARGEDPHIKKDTSQDDNTGKKAANLM